MGHCRDTYSVSRGLNFVMKLSLGVGVGNTIHGLLMGIATEVINRP